VYIRVCFLLDLRCEPAHTVLFLIFFTVSRYESVLFGTLGVLDLVQSASAQFFNKRDTSIGALPRARGACDGHTYVYRHAIPFTFLF
jgi:hypothetical protein